jgi:hypothetical protein
MIISPILVGVDKDDHFDLIFADEGKNCLSVLIVLVVATGESFRTGNESALDGQAISNERRQSFVPMGSLSFFLAESSISVDSSSAFTNALSHHETNSTIMKIRI